MRQARPALVVVCAFLLAWGVNAWAIELGGVERGSSKVACYLPESERMKNTGGSDGPRGPGSGSGLCVFTSVEHAARYQNVIELRGLQQWMTKHPGGGTPSKLQKMIEQYCKEQGVPVPAYLQYEGTDINFVRAVIESGRMGCSTYDGRDGVHYKGHIEHMINIVGFDAQWVVVLDNNFPADAQLVWLTPEEYRSRFIGQGGQGRQGWLFVLLGPGWPPEPPSRGDK
jgi:hypothetical protein